MLKIRFLRILLVLVTLTLLSTLIVTYFTPTEKPRSIPFKSVSWHQVYTDTYIYSAYWDARKEPHIRIIAVGPYDSRHASVTCQIITDDLKIINSYVTYNIMDFENNGYSHTPLFFLCYPSDKKKPNKVRLSFSNNNSSDWLPIRDLTPVGNINNKTAICVRPLFGRFSNNNLIVAEFVAFYQLLGVSHFVFYNHDVPKSLLVLLHEFQNAGISIDILPWDIPKSFQNVWAQGQIASITDCVYRLASSHEYVLVVDLDEFIVPKKNLSIQDILRTVSHREALNSASYVFRNTFFCSDYPDRAETVPLITQTIISRQREIYSWDKRSKSVVRPLAVILPGIHKILLSFGKWKPMTIVDPNIAMLHHYRKEICNFWENWGFESMVDSTALKYQRALLNSVPIKKWKELDEIKRNNNNQY